jgi:hypothetical protein
VASHSIKAQASRLASALLDGRDDIDSLPIPDSGKTYARIHGMGGLFTKERCYRRLARDLANPGMSLNGFPNRDGQRMECAVNKPLERSRTEKTRIKGGKTRGAFKTPSNWAIKHAIKY